MLEQLYDASGVYVTTVTGRLMIINILNIKHHPQILVGLRKLCSE